MRRRYKRKKLGELQLVMERRDEKMWRRRKKKRSDGEDEKEKMELGWKKRKE